MGPDHTALNVDFADIVLTDGRIYTVDEKRSWAEAVAIRDKEIEFVGSNEGVRSFIGPETEVYPLDGRLVLPGFIDSHAHPTMGSLFADMVGLENLPSLKSYQDAVLHFFRNNPGIKVMYGTGWENAHFPPTGPLKGDLDEIVDDIPLSLLSEDGHALWVNSRAIELAGVTKDGPCPKGGVIERDPETGEPSGTFREDAMDLINNALPPLSIEQIKQGLRAFAELAASEGITTIHDAMLFAPGHKGSCLGFGAHRKNTEAFSELAESGDLTLRVRGSFHTSPELGISQLPLLKKACEKYNHPLFQAHSIKFFIDGVVEGHTAYLMEPYTNAPDYYGEKLWEIEDLEEMFNAVEREKLQIHVHSIGDQATKMTLDAFSYASSQNEKRDARHQITHLHLVAEDDFGRFKELDIIGVPQPMWFQKGLDYEELALSYLGRERADRQYPMKRFIDEGVMLASASDWPVSMPCPPLLGIYGGVTRIERGKSGDEDILGPEERVSLEEMIASYTINGAYANFLENETGSIEVGKKADLAVLEQNLFEIPAENIHEARVLLTIFEGREVFRDASFE
jgi:predicted amidohydrolase YtcJ